MSISTPEIDDLRDTLMHARLCHEAWWFFEGSHPSREAMVRAFNYYKDFFGAAGPALFVTFIAKLTSVFDEDKNSVSLKHLPGIDSDTDFSDVWDRGRKLFLYRNKFIAHRDRQAVKDDFQFKTGFTLDGLKQLLDESCGLFDSTAARLGFDPVYNFSCSDDLCRLVDALDPSPERIDQETANS